MLRQLGHRQNSIRTLFERIMINLQIPPEDPEDPDGKEQGR